MKFLSLFFVMTSLFLGSAAMAGACDGQSASCFDSCSQTHKTFANSNSCDSYFNQAKQCHEAAGICNTGSNKCSGSVSCFDACSQSFIEIPFANTCVGEFDSTRQCHAATAVCN